METRIILSVVSLIHKILVGAIYAIAGDKHAIFDCINFTIGDIGIKFPHEFFSHSFSVLSWITWAKIDPLN